MIYALSTPVGSSALAVVRVSGEGCATLLGKLCGWEEGRLPEARRATLCHVLDAAGEVVDECIAIYYAGPASFTGEDMLELICHGGALVTQHVMDRVHECGARPAEPGEFSRRAFENGKMDLTQAEAIMDIISAGSDLALRAAQSQLAGGIYRPVQSAMDRLTDATAHLEAYIDFPEEDISPDSREQIRAVLQEVAEMLDRLLKTAELGRLLREGIRTAIVGAPNAGKSSLLNRLLGYERAIVSSSPGTTRDTVEENICIRGLGLRLIDTAGMRKDAEPIEQAGINRALRAWEDADLVLEVQDATQPRVPLPHAPDSDVPHLLLLNKCDLPMHPSCAELQGDPHTLCISCRTGEGFSFLESRIAELFLAQSEGADSRAAINARHRSALTDAHASLVRATDLLSSSVEPELISIDLRSALDSLGAITGKTDTEDILDRIFSQFCIGK